jgi:hypothetical protein
LQPLTAATHSSSSGGGSSSDGGGSSNSGSITAIGCWGDCQLPDRAPVWHRGWLSWLSVGVVVQRQWV